MEQTGQQGVVARQGLDAADRAAIAALAEMCNRHDRTDLKLNWDMLRTRPPDEVNDFLYYEQGRLIGFLGLYGLGKIEITGMVHPAYRRRGVFRALFAAAEAVCRQRGARSVILVCEPVAPAGRAFAQAYGARYVASEYRMAHTAAPSPPPTERLRLIQAGPADVARLAHITAACFWMEETAARERFAREIREPDRRSYLGWLDSTPIGSINVILEDAEAYIYAFGVLPGYRSQGYGREILTRTVAAMWALGRHKQVLEVACENSNAVALYQSCGFHETTTYDYYEVAF